MFITRATRHDKGDIEEFLERHDWRAEDMKQGVFFFARNGKVVGCVRFIEIAPQTVVVQDMVVDEQRRGEGIGRKLMEAAMNSRGGTLYLRCFEGLTGYYGRLGFAELAGEELPESVLQHFDELGDLPGATSHFMKAR